MMEKDKEIAKFGNDFVLHAQYKMSAMEQKFFYFLVSKINPLDQQFNSIEIPLTDVIKAIKESSIRSGSSYDDINDLISSMSKKQATFKTGVFYNEKRAKAYYNIFQKIEPTSENGVCVQFVFSDWMKPFLLQLQQYVQIGLAEVVPMKNAYAIRMYSVFKSEKDRLSSFKKEIILTYKIEELKLLLGIETEYTDDNFQNFKVRVLNKIVEEINQCSRLMTVSYKLIKPVKKITGVSFVVVDKKPTADKKEKGSKSKLIDDLTKAQLKAYDLLLAYGVDSAIALKQMVLKIQGSELNGYEDVFIQNTLDYFEAHAEQKNAATLVTWWTKNKVFAVGQSAWSIINEKVISHKKSLEIKDYKAYHNREVAKTMSEKEFIIWYQKNK